LINPRKKSGKIRLAEENADGDKKSLIKTLS